jgi:guanylate kinase
MAEMMKGHLFVISGPSGTGKGAICSGLLADENTAISVSMTTRAPRDYEIEGVNYYFVNKEQFLETLAGNGFYEHAEIYGEYYGTPKNPVKDLLEKGMDVILEIDVKGAMQVREQMPEAVLVFILPPSPAELRRRIENRGTETAERIARRLERSDGEIARMGEYDYCVINDDLEKATRDVRMIITAINGSSSGPDFEYAAKRAEELRVGGDTEKIIDKYHAGVLV